MTKTEKELIKALTEAVNALTAAVQRLQPQIITVIKEPAPLTTPLFPPTTVPNGTPWYPSPITPTITCKGMVDPGVTTWNANGSLTHESYT